MRATTDLDTPGTDLRPLVSAMLEVVPPPTDRSDEPFCMQVNQLGYDDYVGRLVIGRVHSGRVKMNQRVQVQTEGKTYTTRITGVFASQGVQRIPMDEASCGDIVVLAGLDEIAIGDTICDPDHPQTLEPIRVDEPTVAMVFQVNNGPLAGKSGGKFLTSRQIRDRLQKEAYANVSIRVEDGESPEQFRVMGRGELQLSVLLETLRREKYELCVRNPQVVTREGENGLEEPIERLTIDVPVEHVGAVTQLIGVRKATMLDQRQEGDRVRVEYTMPTRGLFGLRGQMMTSTRGTAIINHVFDGWIPWTGPIPQRSNGAIIADRAGSATAYSLHKAQPRGVLFVEPGTDVYEGMVIGSHNRSNDLNVNCVRGKKLTNVRAAGKDEATVLAPPKLMSLEESLEWIRDDEMLEVTPEAIRLRKVVLPANMRSVIHPDQL